MHTNQDNINIVVALLKQNNIKQIVISPGGTNIPLIKAIQDDTFFKCYSVVDERSAVYFAIGLFLQTGEIVAMSCTSAQATRNYVPGLTEAYYKRVPILAITMSKHPRFTYQEYMQAPDQTSLPNDAVKASYTLAYVTDDNSYLHSNRIANEAILELSHKGFGPVQLNIPWLDFKLDAEVSYIRSIMKYTICSSWDDLVLEGKNVLIVIGEHRPFNGIQKSSIEAFCDSYDAVVYTNHLSNYHGKYSIKANLQMTTMTQEKFAEEFKPNVIISIGGQTGDYPLYHQLRKVGLQNVEHWRVSMDGNVVDTYDKLTKIFECSEEYFFNKLISSKKSKHMYYEKWDSLVSTSKLDSEVPFSNVYAAQKLHKLIPTNSNIQFSILNSLRVWNLYPLNSNVNCFSNVGAFGIDGGMSTLIGQSMATNNLCFMVIGDLAFLYDMNCLSIRGIGNNVRILLVNNNGGLEFKLWGENAKEQNRYVAAGDSFSTARGWAESCGFDYISAKDCSEFDASCSRFVSPSKKPILLEIFVCDEDEKVAYHTTLDANREFSNTDLLKRNFKKGLKSLLRK